MHFLPILNLLACYPVTPNKYIPGFISKIDDIRKTLLYNIHIKFILQKIKVFLEEARHMRNVFVFLYCILVIAIFSFLPEVNGLQAAGIIFDYSLISIEEKDSEDLAVSENIETDFKFPSRDTSTYPSLLKSWKSSKLVVIDPGHGGKDPGANSGNLLEKDISLDVALRVEKLLKAYKIPTYITRSDDRFIDLHERIQTANDKNAALFVSIHCNWFKSSNLNGVMTLYYPSSTLSSGYLTEIEYAKLLQSELSESLGTKDMGIDDRSNLAVLRHAKMPTALVELGFLSNPHEAELLSSEGFRQKAAEGIAEGIRKSITMISIKKPD
jgi:N-acetylmuramoyl-L-alanine amidase